MPRDTTSSNRRRFLKIAGVAGLTGMAGCGGGGDGGDGSDGSDGGGGSTTTMSGDGGGGGGTTTTQSPGDLLPNPMLGSVASPFKPIYWYAYVPALSSRLEEKYGISVELKTYNGFTAVVAGLYKEEAFLAHVTMDGIVNAVNQGLDVVAPCGWVNQWVFPVIVKPGTDWEDLQGQSMALHSPNSMSTMCGKTMTKEELGTGHDVDFSYILGTPNRVAALESGDVAAAAVSLTGAYEARAQGIADILAFPWDYQSLEGHAPNAWVVMRQNWNERNEELGVVVEELLAIYNEMYEIDARTLVEEAKASGAYGDFNVDTRVEAFEAGIEHDLFAAEGGLQPSRIEKVQNLMVDVDIIAEDEKVARDDFVEDDYLPYA